MMTDLDFDGLLDSTIASVGPQVAPASLGDAVMDGVRGMPQRRPWIRGLDRRAWPAPRRSIADPAMARALRVAVVAMLLVAVLLATAIVAGRFLESRDSRELVFGSTAGGLYVTDLEGSEPRRIATDGKYIEPRVSPDGRWIAVDYIPSGNAFPVRGSTIDRRLVILRADGTSVLDLPSMNPAWTYSWGASGGAEGWLAAALDESIVVVDPATGSRLTIPISGSFRVPVAWSPVAPVLWWTVGTSPSLVDGIEPLTVHSARISAVDGALRIAEERSFDLRLDPRQQIREVERLAVSPDGRTLALRARINMWLRSGVALIDTQGGVADFLTSPPPGEPWISAWSGIRWTPDGRALVVELGQMVDTESAIIRPAILPVDGSAPRFIEAGPFTVDGWGGVVASDGPVLPTDTTFLVGGARDWADMTGGQVTFYDLWLAGANGEGSRLVATDTFGGDLR